MSKNSARNYEADGQAIEMIDVTLALYELLQLDMNEEGVIRNGLLPDEYVKQLHQRLTSRYSQAITLPMVSQAFIALQQLELRDNARGLYRGGMKVSRRRIFLDSQEASVQEGTDRLAVPLKTGMQAKDSEELQQR